MSWCLDVGFSWSISKLLVSTVLARPLWGCRAHTWAAGVLFSHEHKDCKRWKRMSLKHRVNLQKIAHVKERALWPHWGHRSSIVWNGFGWLARRWRHASRCNNIQKTLQKPDQHSQISYFLAWRLHKNKRTLCPPFITNIFCNCDKNFVVVPTNIWKWLAKRNVNEHFQIRPCVGPQGAN